MECWDECHRRRFWCYHWEGIGVVPGKLNIFLETGTALHRVRELALGEGLGVDEALAQALQEYRGKVAEQGIQLDEGADLSQTIEEQYDMVEALSRALFAVWLPKFKREWEVVAVEREVEVDFQVGDTTVRFAARPDLVAQRKVDGTLFIHSLKSMSDLTRRWREQWRYDMQTISEVLAVEQGGEKLGGVIMGGLWKGKYNEYPKGSGQRQHYNPLVWCWTRSDGFNQEFHAEYEWTCDEAHGKCHGGENHRLGPGYTKKRVSQVYPGGVKAWIETLLRGDAGVVERQIIELEPILRSDYEAERWQRQVLKREVRISKQAEVVNAELPEFEDLLNECFPMRTNQGNCLFCPYKDLCWGQAGGDPLNSGFQWRVPHHTGERKALEGGGK